MNDDRLFFEGRNGLGQGKHIVFLAGDEEYRSEEALPQLARILSQRHGFKCTVLFSIGKDGTVDPETQDNQPGLEALKSADLCIMALRFRRWPEAQMKHFAEYLESGKPVMGLRTSTHAFAHLDGPFERFGWQSKTWPGGFGRQILGETWISHWGDHGKQATRGVSVLRHPVLTGVQDVFGTTDVYEAHPPADAEVLMFGEVVAGMKPADAAAKGRKKTRQGREQDLNDPMMPILWIRRAPAGNQILTFTMGAATDLLNEGVRRIVVNGALWMMGMEVPAKAEAGLVGDYRPSAFGFGTFRKGLRAADF